MGSQGRANCKGRCGNRGPPNMLEALSDFFDVESDWLCGKGENVRWCNELFLPTVADTDCSNVQGKEDSRLQRPFGCRGLRKKHILSSCPRGPRGGCTVQERVCDRCWCRRHSILILGGTICDTIACKVRPHVSGCRPFQQIAVPCFDQRFGLLRAQPSTHARPTRDPQHIHSEEPAHLAPGG